MKTSFKPGQKYIFTHLVSIMLLCRGVLIAPILFKISQTFWIVKIKTQWTFWYCNDIGVTSPSISLWHCWCIANETHDHVNFRYQPNIKILRLDQWNFYIVMTSLRQGTLSSRKKSSRIVYLFSISHNNATFILWQLKNQSFRRLFFSCCYEKYVFFFSKQRYST